MASLAAALNSSPSPPPFLHLELDILTSHCEHLPAHLTSSLSGALKHYLQHLYICWLFYLLKPPVTEGVDEAGFAGSLAAKDENMTGGHLPSLTPHTTSMVSDVLMGRVTTHH